MAIVIICLVLSVIAKSTFTLYKQSKKQLNYKKIILFRTRKQKQQPLEHIHCVPEPSHYEKKLGLYDIEHKH